MAAFAAPPDLEVRLQRDLDFGLAQDALDGASAQIRADVGWSVSEESGVTLTLDGPGSQWLLLPTRHLTAVTSVVEEGVTLVLDDDYDWTARGRLIRVGKCWSSKPRSIVVTINHGYPATSPQILKTKQICLNLAGRIIGNPNGARQYSVGGVGETYAGSSDDIGPSLSKTERAELASLRLLAVG